MAGEITDTGVDVATQADLLEEIQNFQRIKISDKLSFSEDTPLGANNPIYAEKVEQIWDLLGEFYNVFDLYNATADRVAAIGAALGIPRRGQTQGLVVQTCTLGAGLTFAAGDLVVSVVGEPENIWENRDAVTTAGAGAYQVVFVSQTAGAAAVAPAGTLTEIVAVSGFTAATNAADATPGFDIEEVGAHRIRIVKATSAGGTRSTTAIRAALVKLSGVLDANVFENVGTVTNFEGVGPHSLRAVVWDGSPAAARNDDIAQTIWDRSATFSQGAQSGQAFDALAGPQTVFFDRATVVDCVVVVVVDSINGVAADDVRTAILSAFPNNLVGVAVINQQLSAAGVRVAGVRKFTTFTLDGSSSADKPAVQNTVYRLTSANITVTGDVT